MIHNNKIAAYTFSIFAISSAIISFYLNINLSITSSKHELSKKLAKRYSSFLVEIGSLRSLSLSYEPRTM